MVQTDEFKLKTLFAMAAATQNIHRL